MDIPAKRTNFVWGLLLVLLGAVALIDTFTALSVWAWAAVLAAAGLVAFLFYLSGRSAFGLLVMAYILWAIAVFLALIELEILVDKAVPTFVLSVIALPFLVVYFRDRSQWWALIPAYVLLAIGLMVILLEDVLTDTLIPAYVMFAIALPFFAVYLRDRRNWWALIPGGIMSIIGLGFLISEGALEYILPAAFIVAGIWMLVRYFAGSKADALASSAGEKPHE